MKNLAILALTLGILSSATQADEAPTLTLAMNSNAVTWLEPTKLISEKSLAEQVELTAAQNMEKISMQLEKQLEEKIAKDLEYAIK